MVQHIHTLIKAAVNGYAKTVRKNADPYLRNTWRPCELRTPHW